MINRYMSNEKTASQTADADGADDCEHRAEDARNARDFQNLSACCR